MTETVEGVCNIVADNSSKVEEEEKLNMAVNEKNIEDITSSVKKEENSVQFVLVYQNQRLQITFELDNTILKLKEHVQTLTGFFYFIYSKSNFISILSRNSTKYAKNYV
jgi:hypothetical protein